MKMITIQEIENCKIFLKPAVQTYQLSEDTYNSILEDLKQKAKGVTVEHSIEFLTVPEASKLLKRSAVSIYKDIKSGKFQARKLGNRCTRLIKSDILKAMNIQQ